jgi:hypothetical protein
MSKRYSSYLMLVSACVMSLVLCEAALRRLSGERVFALKNFREEQAIVVNLNGLIKYDPQLGWAYADHNRDVDIKFSTAAYGIRRHIESQSQPRKGAILVAGSSFAAGGEVSDTETWPAQLEAMIGHPVENSAVGGYGVDQIVMRAESLLTIFEPSTVIIEVMNTSIQWVSYSYLGWPKPFYTLAGGHLSEHNVPVPRSVPRTALARSGLLKTIGGYSLIVDRIMSAIDAESWYAQSKIETVDTDPIAISCALLQRLKRETDQRAIHAVLVAMVAASDIMPSGEPPTALSGVESCARSMGYDIVSVFDRMRPIYRDDPGSMGVYYVPHGTAFGHSTSRGNYEVPASSLTY